MPIKNADDTYRVFRNLLLEEFNYNQILDFVEFMSSTNIIHGRIIEGKNDWFLLECNSIFNEEGIGYQFINGQITSITDPLEINKIEESLNVFKPSKVHLINALRLLSDKKEPDYKNSIKEAISAVESICTHISTKNTLGDALKEICKSGKVDIHGSLKEGFLKIYGYTSDAGGIRHSLEFNDSNNVDYEDAKFMLIACSAFINYLKVKIDKAGIKL
ncbi:MAG: hypothetical protein A2Y40_09585 [Candidatus Margulisbacteria bacterium GWF2_35_9]|nr:MAG: hypothetical protein A2Y40_09585 [Candidatus Margulisbacteria bacterium GWF2_35_9]